MIDDDEHTKIQNIVNAIYVIMIIDDKMIKMNMTNKRQ